MKNLLKKFICICAAISMLFMYACTGGLATNSNTAAAKQSTSTMYVNQISVTLPAYNIDGYNYIKLRDIAMILNGTEKQFNIEYDSKTNAINITTGIEYTAIGTELTAEKASSSTEARTSSAVVYIDKTEVKFTAYNINGSNYFKLRDIASKLDFNVSYDSGSGNVSIDTSSQYTGSDTEQGDAPGAIPGGNPGKGPGGNPPAGGSAPGGMPGGGSGSVNTGTGAYILGNGEKLTGGTYTSIKADENAVRAEGGITASLSDVTVKKTAGASSSSDASSFYGLNSAILALDGATLNITGGSVTAAAEGANGVFAYGGATINITDTVINVTGGNAGGIEVSGGGIINASNLTVNSTVKAAIRSDRGGGTLTVDGGTYTTNGSSGAPAIYSTADITVSNATLTSNDSEAVVVEGLNSVTLNNCTVTGNMSGVYGASSSENIHNIMLYQSMSGDAETGTSSFTMTGGTLVSKNGDMFYVTNTSSVITLSGVKLTLSGGAYLLLVAGNNSSRGWGSVGQNGGDCEFNLTGQTVSGDIMVDKISTLDMNITKSSSYTGAVNSDGTAASALSVTIDSTSTWTLTSDSYITEFNGSIKNVVSNGHKLYVNGTAIN